MRGAANFRSRLCHVSETIHSCVFTSSGQSETTDITDSKVPPGYNQGIRVNTRHSIIMFVINNVKGVIIS